MADLKFRMTPGASGADLTFQLLREEGEALAATEDFADRDACLAAIQEAAEALNDEQPFAVRAAPGGQVLELSAPDGRALARSGPLSAGAAATLRDALAEAASEQEEYQIDLPPTTTMRAQTVPAFLSAPHVISAADYDFAWPSSSGVAGFESFQNARDGRYYFHFNDAQGEALLYSRGFSDVSQRNKRLRAVLAGGTTEQRYERREEGGRHFFILKGRNGQEIARSRAFLTLGAMEAALVWLWLEMPQQAVQYASQTKVRKSGANKGGGSRFNLALASLTGIAGFELLRNALDRRHYFLFNGEDGRPLLFSQGYKTSAGRDQGVRSLIRLGANPARYEAAQESGQHYFAVRAGNRQEIARSQDFGSEEAATAAMRHLQTRIPTWAAAFAIPAEMLETSAGEHLMIRVPRAEALEGSAAIPAAAVPAALLAGAVIGAGAAAPALGEAALPAAALPAALLGGAAIGAETAAPALGEAAPPPPVEAATAGPVAEALETPTIPEPAPVTPAPALTPVPPQRIAPSAARRFWPVPVAVLALGCLAWGLSGHLPKKSDGAPKSAPLQSSVPQSSALVPAVASSGAVSPSVQPAPKSGLQGVPALAAGAGSHPNSLSSDRQMAHAAKLQDGGSLEHPSSPPVTVKVGAYKEHRVSHPTHHSRRRDVSPNATIFDRPYHGGS